MSGIEVLSRTQRIIVLPNTSVSIVKEGPQGPQGIIGPKGLVGPQGIAGPQGPQGIVGSQGIAGPQGIVGPQGIIGPDGPQGLVGPGGPTGDTGDIGLTGPQGLVGPVGETGAIGPIGLTGPIGDTGPQGIQGPEMGIGYRAGIRSMPGWWGMTGLVPGSVAGGAGTFYLMAILLAEDIPIDAVGINVVTAVASTTHQGLIYACNAEHKPEALISDTTFNTTTTGLKLVTIPRLVLPRGLLWIGGMSLGGAPTITFVNGNPPLFVSPSQVSTGYAGGVARTGLTSAPDPAGEVIAVGSAPRLQFRMVV
jgi:hypothetical protein